MTNFPEGTFQHFCVACGELTLIDSTGKCLPCRGTVAIPPESTIEMETPISEMKFESEEDLVAFIQAQTAKLKREN